MTSTTPTLRSTSVPTTSETATLNDDMLNTKIKNATEGLSCNCFNYLSNRVLPGSKGKENALTICNYMSSIKSEINPSDHYRKSTIILLCNLSIFFKNAKPFKEITRGDLLSFLDSYRKPDTPTMQDIGNFLGLLYDQQRIGNTRPRIVELNEVDGRQIQTPGNL